MIRGLQDITRKQLRGLRRRRNRNVGCVWEFRASQQGWAVICGYKESTARLSRNQRQSAQIDPGDGMFNRYVCLGSTAGAGAGPAPADQPHLNRERGFPTARIQNTALFTWEHGGNRRVCSSPGCERGFSTTHIENTTLFTGEHGGN